MRKETMKIVWLILTSGLACLSLFAEPENAPSASNAKPVYILRDSSVPPAVFAAKEIKQAIEGEGGHAAFRELSEISNTGSAYNIIIAQHTAQAVMDRLVDAKGRAVPDLAREAYSIRVTQTDGIKSYWVIGGDSSGAMYGALDLAEKIELGELANTKSSDHRPYLEKRGIKFNIPLDGRNPAYSDAGDAFQANIETVWDQTFWQEYLDELARQRYNCISLWNMHPFPSLIKMEDYPDVALQDVMAADLDWDAFNRGFQLSGGNMANREIMNNLVVVKNMTIDEKIAFWQEVMQYAHDRGIEFYFITWNVFVWGTEGQYGIEQNATNEETIRYMRKAVYELFKTYPLLAGIGVTAGENMHGIENDQKEEWLMATYGQGVLDTLKDHPERNIRFIHRYWWTDANNIIRHFQPLIDQDVIFDMSFKYAKARLYSDTDPHFSDGAFNGLPEGFRMWCNLRNDDIYHLRWGDPDYVRSFIKNLPPGNKTPGFYMGSDGYVFAREVTSKTPSTPRQLEIKKSWYNSMLWARLGYDPSTPDSYFKKVMAHRFPAVDADKLFSAWQQSSKVIPTVNKFHWHDWDFQWNVESCMKRHNHFESVDDFMKRPTMSGVDWYTIPEYCDRMIDDGSIDKKTPLDVADELIEYADAALNDLPSVSPSQDPELQETVNDIEAMAQLGYYYAYKIRGTVNLYFFDKRGERSDQKAAVSDLKQAYEFLQKYTDQMKSRYKSTLLSRIGRVDWDWMLQQAQKEVSTAQNR